VDLIEGSFGNPIGFFSEKLQTGKLTTNELLTALTAPRHWPSQTNSLTAGQQLAETLTEEFFAQLQTAAP
jgi:hypothetical protein